MRVFGILTFKNEADKPTNQPFQYFSDFIRSTFHPNFFSFPLTVTSINWGGIDTLAD